MPYGLVIRRRMKRLLDAEALIESGAVTCSLDAVPELNGTEALDQISDHFASSPEAST